MSVTAEVKFGKLELNSFGIQISPDNGVKRIHQVAFDNVKFLFVNSLFILILYKIIDVYRCVKRKPVLRVRVDYFSGCCVSKVASQATE